MVSPGLGSHPSNSKPSGSSLRVDGGSRSEDSRSGDAAADLMEECESPSLAGADESHDEESPQPRRIKGHTKRDEEDGSAPSGESLEEEEDGKTEVEEKTYGDGSALTGVDVTKKASKHQVT